MTSASVYDPCIITGCPESRSLNSYLCPEHDAEWRLSPEFTRADEGRSRSMVADFVRRVSAERVTR